MKKKTRKEKWQMAKDQICGPEEAEKDEFWLEMLKFSDSFVLCCKGCRLAREFKNPKWIDVFSLKMTKKARCIAHWKVIAGCGIEYHRPYDLAIEKIYEDAKEFEVLYRWRELGRLIGVWHFHFSEVQAIIGRLKVEKNKQKMAA